MVQTDGDEMNVRDDEFSERQKEMEEDNLLQLNHKIMRMLKFQSMIDHSLKER